MARGEWQETTELIQAAAGILEREHPMTVRQLFYRLVSVAVIKNSRADYQKVSKVMTKAREDGRVDYQWIVDRSRPEYVPNVFKDLAGYGRAIHRSYRKDNWESQPNYVELWCEKDSVTGSIQDITDELGITLRVGRGFQSATRVYEIAPLFSKIKKPKIVFYLGDHDPSGQDIERDLRERVTTKLEAARRASFLTELAKASDDHHQSLIDKFNFSEVPFSLERLAIFAEDIKKFKLPPLRIKDSDSRARQFCKQHGRDCVELDALPPSELRRRIRSVVEAEMDMEAWKRAVEVEKVELASIAATIGSWPTMEAQ